MTVAAKSKRKTSSPKKQALRTANPPALRVQEPEKQAKKVNPFHQRLARQPGRR